VEGAPHLKRLVERAGDRIMIIAGGKVTPTNVAALVQETGVQMVHGREYAGMLRAVEGL